MSARQPRFEIVRTSRGWHARFRAANGQIVWTTESYTRRRAAVNAIAAILYPCSDVTYADEVREVDERYVPPPVVLELPIYHRTIYPIVDLGTRNAHRGPAEDFWHDREYHWRNCDGTTDQGGDCTEAIPPKGTEVRSRTGSARYQP